MLNGLYLVPLAIWYVYGEDIYYSTINEPLHLVVNTSVQSRILGLIQMTKIIIIFPLSEILHLWRVTLLYLSRVE